MTYAIAAPALQMTVGHWDRRKLVVVGLVGIAIGALLSAMASSFLILALARIVMAVGGALVRPMASAAGASLVPGDGQSRALGTDFAGMTIATVFGKPLSSFGGAELGWRPVLALIAGLAIGVAGAVLILLPRCSTGQRTTLQALLAVVNGKATALAISVTFFQLAAQFTTYALISVYLTRIQGFTDTLVPVALMVFGIGGLLGNALATQLVGLLGFNQLIPISLGVLTLVFCALIFLPKSTTIAFVLLLFWDVAGTMMMAPQQARCVSLAPEQRNLLLALNASALFLGMAGGAVLAGLLDAKFGVTVLPAVSLCLALLAFAAFIFLHHSASTHLKPKGEKP